MDNDEKSANDGVQPELEVVAHEETAPARPEKILQLTASPNPIAPNGAGERTREIPCQTSRRFEP